MYLWSTDDQIFPHSSDSTSVGEYFIFEISPNKTLAAFAIGMDRQPQFLTFILVVHSWSLMWSCTLLGSF